MWHQTLTIVNKYRLTLSDQDRFVNIISLKYDLTGQEDLIQEYEKEVLEEVINPILNFEVTKYSHDKYEGSENGKTYLNYKFIFDFSVPITNTSFNDSNKW